jgi:hypothetical protein
VACHLAPENRGIEAGRNCLFTAGKELVKLVPDVTNTNETIEELLEMVFSTGSAPSLYSETLREKLVSCGSETENVTCSHGLDVMEVGDIVGTRYQAMTDEDGADWEDITCAVVICKAWILVKLL